VAVRQDDRAIGEERRNGAWGVDQANWIRGGREALVEGQGNEGQRNGQDSI
jgi:hypothetical protein